jgi:hypothetical protein
MQITQANQRINCLLHKALAMQKTKKMYMKAV